MCQYVEKKASIYSSNFISQQIASNHKKNLYVLYMEIIYLYFKLKKPADWKDNWNFTQKTYRKHTKQFKCCKYLLLT